jgi:hypothetical protein
MTATPTKMWIKLARRMGFDRNPLRRPCDRIAVWLLPAVLAVFVGLCPVVAGVAGNWIRKDNAAALHASLTWHKVRAVLLESAPGPEQAPNGASTWIEWMPARWVSGGRPHTADVPAIAGSKEGTTLTVWLNPAGQVQSAPLTPVQVTDRVTATTAVVLAGLIVVLASLAWLGRWWLDRRRLAGWESAWLSVGPRWSRHG